MKLSTLKQSRPTHTTVDLGEGESIVLVYDRAVITKDWKPTLTHAREAAATSPKEREAVIMTRIDRLSDLLISWDVTQDDGKPYQPQVNLNGERPAAWATLLEALPPDVLRAVEEAIWDDYYAGKPLGGGSTAT